MLCHDNKRVVSAGAAPHVTYGSIVYCVWTCRRLILVTLWSVLVGHGLTKAVVSDWVTEGAETLLGCGAGEVWRPVGPIVWNGAVLQGVKEEPSILRRIKKSKANWIGHILHRNCLPTQVIGANMEGRIEVTGRRGSRRNQLLDDLQDKRGCTVAVWYFALTSTVV